MDPDQLPSVKKPADLNPHCIIVGWCFFQVKKIMNTVYKDLREQFEADETYAGSDILAAILNAIKVSVLSLGTPLPN